VDSFAELAGEERRVYFEQAAARLGLSPESVEKDFWVCWTLRLLFGLPTWGSHLTFKGGTSLSKGWRLIERFSEDIDVVIDREPLGFGGSDSPDQAPSKKQRKQRLEALKAASQKRIQEDLYPALKDALTKALSPERKATLERASIDEDPEQQTLLFQYPAIFTVEYLRPEVRIELGARSDTEPSDSPTIRPYLAEAFPDLLKDAAFPVRAVAPRRTFWKKAFLLHEETFRPMDKPRKRPLARHYYDVFRLIANGVADDAMADEGLFDRVAEHRQIFFGQNWVDYTTLGRGSLRLVPATDQMADWERDYKAMRGEMFFGDVPTFTEVIRTVQEFENRFNKASTNTASDENRFTAGSESAETSET